jgi:hypothetical protein
MAPLKKVKNIRQYVFSGRTTSTRSEASFSEAFKQYMGVGPGAVRKNRGP